MTEEPIDARLAGPGDQESLSEFRCSTGAWFEDDVERYVRTRAYNDARTGYLYALLVLEQAGQLIGCAAWRPLVLSFGEAESVLISTHLQFVALALAHQGHVLPSGNRLSDSFFQTVLAQALGPAGRGVVSAFAAVDNVRSIKLCERNGLTAQTRYDSHHTMLTGAFGTDPTWHNESPA